MNKPSSKTSRNKKRRDQYNDDSDFREKAKQRSRNTYRDSNPKQYNKYTDLKKSPTERQVKSIVSARSNFFTCSTYTINEMADALAKSPLTLKRWIADEVIPAPVLQDDVYGYMHYSMNEVLIIAECLERHDEHHTYLNVTHTVTILCIDQTLEAIRRSNDF